MAHAHVIDLTLSSDDEAAPAPPAPKRARTAAAGGDSDVEIVEPCADDGPLAPRSDAAAAADADADVVVTGVSGVVRTAARAAAGRVTWHLRRTLSAAKRP